MSEPFTSKQGSLYLQIGSDEMPSWFPCSDLGDLPKPYGDLTPIYCRDAKGRQKIVGTTEGNPALGTTTITAKLFPESDILDRLTSCDFTMYAFLRNCGNAGIFPNRVYGVVVYKARLTNFNRQNLVKEEDGTVMRVLDVSYQDSFDIREVTAVRQTIAETRDLNDIVFDLNAQCAGDCGGTQNDDDDGFIVTDGGVASPPSDADVWSTIDKGVTWANATALVPSPFAGGNIVSAVRFQVDKSTYRLLVASGPKAGYAQVAYSDDEGATWTTVDVGATAWEGAAAADALFAFDQNHIWFATDHGRVYESVNGGLTWTSEASALVASLARSLNGVRFFDYLTGYAFGDNDTIIKTIDGGDNWTRLTAPTSSDNVTALSVGTDNKNLVWCGSNADGLWVSVNGGSTWTAVVFTGQGTTGTVRWIEMLNDKIGWMIHNTSAPLGSVHRTVNGGVSWEKVTTPTNAGLNSGFVISANECYAVGNAQSGTGVVIKVSG